MKSNSLARGGFVDRLSRRGCIPLGIRSRRLFFVFSGLAPSNCFSKPLRKEDPPDRIGIEHAVRLHAVQKTGDGIGKKYQTNIAGGGESDDCFDSHEETC